MSASLERTVVTGMLAAVVAVVIVMTFSLGAVARVAPLAAGVPTLALLVVELARDVRRARVSNPDVSRRSTDARLLGWLVLLLGLVAVLGVPVGVPAWLGLFLRLRSRERWMVVFVMAGGLALVLHGVLVLLLRLSPAAGALPRWPL